MKNGDHRAADFLSAEFKKAGLTGPVQGGYFQGFAFPVNTFPTRLKVGLNKKQLEAGEDFIVHPGSPSCQGNYPVLRITRGPAHYRAEDLAGKWLLLDTSRAGNEIGKAEFREWVKHPPGGKGLLIVEPAKLTWSVSTSLNKSPVIYVLKKALPDTVFSLDIDIRSEFREHHTTRNVIGMIEGSTHKDSLLFICAHYDHLGRMGRKTYFPGANDNASGIAMLLNLARHYSKHRPACSMVFVAFAGEEAGLLGSKYYTEHPLWPMSHIRFLLNLDLLGTGEEGLMVVNASLFPDLFARLDSVNREKMFLPQLGKRGPAANSDHYWFSEAGVPAFFCYTMGGISAYHDIYDREETLPLTKFKECFQLFTGFLDTLQPSNRN
ncbi:MAG: Zn-dependent exopeptidase M28 [Bacteroidia bacterium]|nr:Zn-dependent exopeptidase M28 [Bacteroidia bacterium]